MLVKNGIAIGTNDKGYWLELPKHPSHTMIAGATRSGKSSFLYSYMILQNRNDNVKFMGYDPEYVLDRVFENRNHEWIGLDNSWEEILEWFRGLRREMQSRRKLLEIYGPRYRVDKLSEGMVEFLIIVFEEFASVRILADEHKKDGGEEVLNILNELTARSAKLFMQVVICTQRAEASILTGALRMNLPNRICFRCDNSDSVRMVIPEATTEQVNSLIGEAKPGVGLCKLAHINGIHKFKSFRVDYSQYLREMTGFEGL